MLAKVKLPNGRERSITCNAAIPRLAVILAQNSGGVPLPSRTAVPHDLLQRLRMGRLLDEGAAHRRDLDRGVVLEQIPGRLDDPEVGIDAAQPVRLAVDEGREVALGRHEDDAARIDKAVGASAIGMPVQAADALQEHIHRAQIGDQEVGVDVEALLERLGADDDESTRAGSIATEPHLHGLVEQQPVLEREPAMVESGHALDSEEQVEQARPGEPVAEGLEQRHRIGDGVAHDEHLRACVGGAHSLGDNFLRLVEMGPAARSPPA